MKPLTYIKFFLFVLLFFGVERLCHRATDGFALVNIYSPEGDTRLWESDSPLKMSLDQPFYYLNSGSQSYVFLSEDGQTVLKFFKFQHMRIPPWINYLPLPSTLAQKREVKREKKRAVLTRTMNSYKIAFERMAEETGLLYVHLAPSSHLNQTVTIYDKIGKRHEIELDQVEFVLQKKASLVYDSLNEWMANGQKEKAKQGIRNLLILALERCKKGIFDKDPDFSTNFGFVNEMPVQIDVGRLSLDEQEKNPAIHCGEMIRITRDFQKWIEINHPDLLEFFDEEIQKLTAQN